MIGLELKPCPFCGGDAEAWEFKDRGFPRATVRCDDCSVSAAHYHTIEEAVIAWNKRTGSDHQPIYVFTGKESLIADCLKEGKANKQIAFELKISESSVKIHVRNIMLKMNASNRSQVTYKLWSGHGLVNSTS